MPVETALINRWCLKGAFFLFYLRESEVYVWFSVALTIGHLHVDR
jgi:hypothetical protein